MEKTIKRITAMKEEIFAEKSDRIRRWRKADLAVLLVLAMCTQIWSNLEFAGETYIRNVNIYNISNSMITNYGGGVVKNYTGMIVNGTNDAKELAESTCVPTIGTTTATAETAIKETATTGSAAAETEERNVSAAETHPSQEMTGTVTNTVAANTEISKTTDAGNAASDIADTEPASEPASVIEEAENNEEALRGTPIKLDGFVIGTDGVIEYCENPGAVAEDGIVILPSDERCTGIGEEALSGITGAEEIYIPANITYIASEALAKLEGLMYIEVAPDNPVYESIDGVLYNKTGELIYNPFSC